MKPNAAFTLIEVIAASLAATILLLGVYGLFQRVEKTSARSRERAEAARLRERAGATLGNDLRGALLSGGLLAGTMEGGASAPGSRFPGYLRFTTTTGRDTNEEAWGDVQQVEYYVSDKAVGQNGGAGAFVRLLTRDLLSGTGSQGSANAVAADEETVLPNVRGMEVSFFDGQNWQESWQVSGTNASTGSGAFMSSASLSGTTTLPQAVRVRLLCAPAQEGSATPPPLEVFMPLTATPFVTSGTTAASGT